MKANLPKTKPSVKIYRINIRKILTYAAIFFGIMFVLSFFNRTSDGKELSISEFISNAKSNQYSVIEVRDDGKSVALGKTYNIVDVSNELDDRDIKVISEFETADINKLYDLVKPLSLQDSISLLTQPTLFPRSSELFITDNFIIASPVISSSKPFIIKSVDSSDYQRLLASKGVKEGDITVKVSNALNTSEVLDYKDFIANYIGGKYEKIWSVDGMYIAKLKTEYIPMHYIYWSSLSDGVTGFSSLLQGEKVSLDSNLTKISYVKTFQMPWGDIITTLFLGGLIFISITMFRGIQGGGNSLMKFGQSKARMFFGRKPDVTFKDVAGIDEAKEELKEIVMFLREPKKFIDVGARIPKGVLMVGAPGTGKTLLARAIAGEAGVPFFHTSGSEFEEMLVGAGASRVRDLFDKAKRAAPSLIFIDEIDAVARKRGTTVNSGTTEQTLNQILVEMDGFEKNLNLIVIAATNRPDVLDPAILRPGRFDRRVTLDLPDLEGRRQIIDIHAKNKPISKDVDLNVVARRTVGFSGADIENMLNEAAIIIAKEGRKEITLLDFEEAATKVQIGPAKVSRKRVEKELRKTAYHEVGHALVMKMVPEHDPVHRVTIVSRGMALGYTMPLADKDKVSMTKTEMMSNIKALLAGFATEEIVFGDVTSGASNDIEKATSIAKKMVKSFGMSKKLGLVKYGQEEDHQYLGYSYGGGNKDYSEDTARNIDEEVRSIINEALNDTKHIINKNRKLMDEIVEVLMVKETIEADEFNAFFKDMKTGNETEE